MPIVHTELSGGDVRWMISRASFSKQTARAGERRHIEMLCRLLVVGCGCLGAAGCQTLPGDFTVERASKEFYRPIEKIGVIERSDISDHVYDLDACGERVRYSCVSLPDDNLLLTENDPNGCVREMDPKKWDLDPATVTSLPRPSSPVQFVRSTAGESRRICWVCNTRTGADCRADDCIYRENGSWRRRETNDGVGNGGAGGLDHTAPDAGTQSAAPQSRGPAGGDASGCHGLEMKCADGPIASRSH